MDNNDLVKELFSDIEIPKQLEPENIAKMLKEYQATHKDKDKIASPDRSSIKINKSFKRNKIIATAAAVVIVATGLVGYIINNDNNTISDPGNVGTAMTQPHASNQSDLISTINSNKANGTTYNVESDEESTLSGEKIGNSQMGNSVVYAPKLDYDEKIVNDINKADIVKATKNNIFFVTDNKLNVINIRNGEMELAVSIDCPGTKYNNILLENNYLIVISEKEYKKTDDTNTDTSNETEDIKDNNDSDFNLSNSFDNNTYIKSTFIQVYDCNKTGDVNDLIVTTKEQAGEYKTAISDENGINIVTTMSIPSYLPVDNDSYPWYTDSNGEKVSIDTKNIITPVNFTNVSYDIVGNYKFAQDSDTEQNVYAVMSSSGHVYVNNNNIYVFSSTKENDNYFTDVRLFNFNENQFGELSAHIPGIIEDDSVNIYNDNMTIISYKSSDDVKKYSLYIIDKDFKQIGKVNNFIEQSEDISFEYYNNIAYVIDKESNCIMAIDYDNFERPSIDTSSEQIKRIGNLTRFGDNKYIGLNGVMDTGTNQYSISISILEYDGQNYNTLHSTTLSSLSVSESWFKENIINEDALLISRENNIIGIPVCYYNGVVYINRYYLYRYDETKGFIPLNSEETTSTDYIECTDSGSAENTINDFRFNRSIILDNYLYIISPTRIISIDLSSGKLIAELKL